MSLWDSVKDFGSGVWDNLKDGDVFGAIGDVLDAAFDVFTLGMGDDIVDGIAGMLGQQVPESNMSDRKNTVRASASPRSVIYGTARVGGQVVYLESTGPDSEYLHLVVVFAAHSCKRVKRIYFGDDVLATYHELTDQYYLSGRYVPPEYEEVDFGGFMGLDSVRFPTDAKPSVEFHIEHGRQSDVDPFVLDRTPANWTAAHKLLGHTYVYFKLRYDKHRFQGIPKITAEIEGKDDIELADGTTGWTDNHALCVKNYLLWDRGFRASPDDVDMASFEHAADAADELIGDGPAGVWNSGAEKRYTLNGAFKINTTPLNNLQSMLKAGAATMTYSQGVWSINPGVYKAPVASYDESDLIGGVQFTPGAGKADRVNTATGTIISPGHDYEATDFVPISVPTYLDRDGEELTVDLSLAFTNSGTMARRIGKILIERSRFGVGAQVTLKHYAIDRKIGDRIRLSISTLGWVGKVFRISDIQFSLGSGVALTLREDAEAIYTWEEGENLVVPVPPAISLPNARFVTPPKSLAIVEDSYQDTNGDTRVRANFLYEPGGASTGSYDVEFKLQSAPDWTRAYSAWTDVRAKISDLPPGAYTFRVRGINGIGIKSAWASISHEFEGIENYWPLPVADMALQELTDKPPSPRAQFSTIRATITPPADPLFSHALIEYQLDGDAAWVVSGPTDAQERRDIIVLTDGLGYRVRAFSVSTTGIVSATAITRSLGVSDIDDPLDLPNIAPLNAVTGLAVEGGGTSFSGKDAKIIWQDPNRGSLYVKEYAVEVRTPGDALLRSTVTAVPEFVYTAEANAEDYERLNGSAGMNRQFKVSVKVVGRLDDGTRTHESPSASALIENPAPGLPTNLNVAAGYQLIKVSFDKPTDLDYTETRIWMGTTTGFAISDSTLVAVTYGGPVTLAGIPDDADRYIRVATYDAYGQGSLSSELYVRTADLGLSPWAYVDNADRAFIDANMANDAVDSEKIVKLVASKIVTGVLAATESISAGDPLTEPYTMTLGGKAFGTDVALISVEQNATGNAIFAAFESGRVQLNANANVWANGGFLFGSQDKLGDYIEFDGTRIIVDTPEFSLDALGNATFGGNLSAASGTFAGALSAATGTFAGELQAATGSFSGSLSAATGTFSGELQAATGTFSGSISAATGTFTGSLNSGGTVRFGNSSKYVYWDGSVLQASEMQTLGDIYIGDASGSIGFLTPWTGYVGSTIQDILNDIGDLQGAVHSTTYGDIRSYSTGSKTSSLSMGSTATFDGKSGSWRVMGLVGSETDDVGITTYDYLIVRIS